MLILLFFFKNVPRIFYIFLKMGEFDLHCVILHVQDSLSSVISDFYVQYSVLGVGSMLPDTGVKLFANH